MGRIIHQSVSCVITTKQHVLVAKRSRNLRHFPGYWALPGGRVESKDECIEDALSRELYEELGISIETSAYRYIGHCLTPDFAPYRFENQVYHYHYDQEALPVMTLNNEHESYVWISKYKLDDFFNNQKSLRVPMLPWFIDKAIKSQTGDFLNNYLDEQRELLKASYLPGMQTYIVPSRSLPPAKHTNVLVIENWLIDPAPKDLLHIDILVDNWRDDGIDSIFISHWHLDHHEHLSLVATKLQAQVYLSQATKEIVEDHWGVDYFDNLVIQILEPNQVIQTQSGQELKVVAHDGHAIGQLGLEHIEGIWCFVSDVFQGVGSVVVEDMNSYMECLDELIQKPKQTIFIPSHGLPIGGNGVLRKIYQHRLKREEQVSALLEKDMSPNDILQELYPSLKEELHKHALKNINGHIQRIRSFKKS